MLRETQVCTELRPQYKLLRCGHIVLSVIRNGLGIVLAWILAVRYQSFRKDCFAWLRTFLKRLL